MADLYKNISFNFMGFDDILWNPGFYSSNTTSNNLCLFFCVTMFQKVFRCFIDAFCSTSHLSDLFLYHLLL